MRQACPLLWCGPALIWHGCLRRVLQPAGDQTVSSFSFFCPISPQHITTRGTLFVLLCGRLLWLCIRRGVALLRTYTLLLAVPTLPFTQQSVPSRASRPGSSLTYRNRLRTSGPLSASQPCSRWCPTLSSSGNLSNQAKLRTWRRPQQLGRAGSSQRGARACLAWTRGQPPPRSLLNKNLTRTPIRKVVPWQVASSDLPAKFSVRNSLSVLCCRRKSCTDGDLSLSPAEGLLALCF